ncbi:hypothetical protein H9P43_009660 [Blastocladiella emersonii ATCC 22665]|nr:hypothetical protein H9P43_009660 [Blastocladiella emersonii ATCC 22665]
MSRHRNIRNMTADDYEDFSDGEESAAFETAMHELREIVGDSFPDAELEETLEYYHLDIAKCVSWLLDGVDPEVEGTLGSTAAAKPKGPPPTIRHRPPKPTPAAAKPAGSLLAGSALGSLLAPKLGAAAPAKPSLLAGSALGSLLTPKPGAAPAAAKPSLLAGSALGALAAPKPATGAAAAAAAKPSLLAGSALGALATPKPAAGAAAAAKPSLLSGSALGALAARRSAPAPAAAAKPSLLAGSALGALVAPKPASPVAPGGKPSLLAGSSLLGSLVAPKPGTAAAASPKPNGGGLATSALGALLAPKKPVSPPKPVLAPLPAALLAKPAPVPATVPVAASFDDGEHPASPSSHSRMALPSLFARAIASTTTRRTTTSAAAPSRRRTRRIFPDPAPYPSCFLPTYAITPFAFDTPSPDDLVFTAQAQSKAFSSAPATPAAPAKSKQQPAGNGKKVPQTPPPATKSAGSAPASTVAAGKGTNKKNGAPPAPPAKLANPMDGIAASVAELGITVAPAAPPAPVVSKKKIDIVAEAAKRTEHLNLVIVGHVDAGKSTLTGHLMYQLGEVTDKTMQRYSRDSSKAGKGSFAFAWVMDQSAEERARGVTIDVGVHHLTTPSGHRVYTLLDAPGHRDFIPNMISGAAQADVAVLVVDAVGGEFEAGLDGGGQAREHLLLVKSLGIPRLVVAVNKMDSNSVQWSQARFDAIQAALAGFLGTIGYNPNTQVAFVPTSGLTGTNLRERVDPAVCDWYAGPSLLEVLDTLPVPARPVAKPLRMLVSDYSKGGMASGTVTVWGRIECGGIQVGETVLLMPLGEDAVVRHLEVNDQTVKWAAAGDHVTVSLSGPDAQQLSTGLVVSSKSHPVPVTNRVEAKVLVFDPKVPVTLGYPVILHQGTLNEPAVVSKLIAVLDKVDGKVTKKNPRVLTKGTTALVEVTTDRPVCLEPFTESKEFGRFMLRKAGETLAAGIVSKIVSVYQPAAMRNENRGGAAAAAWSVNED